MEEYVPQYMSDLGVMRRVAAELHAQPWIIHLANSSAIRNAACYLRPSAHHRIFANRGTNGIEGSLSTAIGHALRTDQPVLLLIGDLSFFYDLSALALPSLPRRLRIVLFNNGGGQIFSRLPGLEQSPALPAYISAQSHHTASGIATAFGLRYAQAIHSPLRRGGVSRAKRGEGEGLLIIKQMLLLLRRQAVIARPSDLVQNAVGLLLVLLLAGVIIPVGVAGA